MQLVQQIMVGELRIQGCIKLNNKQGFQDLFFPNKIKALNGSNIESFAD